MNDYRNLLIKGIKEAALLGNNIKKAFDGQQGKDESPTEWLRRLRQNIQQYLGMDPDSGTNPIEDPFCDKGVTRH